LKIITKIEEIKNHIHRLKNENHIISFIPTMGNLHNGHLSLIKKSQSIVSKKIVSIFINPLQFNNKKDFDAYPRKIDKDIECLKTQNIDCLFLPDENILDDLPIIDTLPDGFTKILCGKYRPNHFIGVYKIVLRLFNIISPDYVFFGEKDYQQLLLIKFLIQKNKLNIKINECETIRDLNGLALSSRNNLLTQNQKKIASSIYKLMQEYTMKSNIKHQILSYFEDKIDKLIETEYCEVIETKDLYDIHGLDIIDSDINFKYRLFYAGYISGVRLIDNLSFN
tara:strand:- start:36475 stop:37317 length:843 start_codon:yes stop_codon:yes gene_type:complete